MNCGVEFSGIPLVQAAFDALICLEGKMQAVVISREKFILSASL